MAQIQLIGTKKLDEIEKKLVNKLANEYYQKIVRSLRNITNVVLDLKSYKKSGKKQKYSLHVRVNGPFKTFEASAVDWDLARVVHEAFKAIEREIQHKFHTDNQKPRKK